jgi:predicted permease
MWIEDLRAAFRSLRSAPGFTVTAVLSLALGIGGTVAMFTLVNSIVLKPLPYPESDRLMLVANTTDRIISGNAAPLLGLTPQQFIRWRKEIGAFESIALSTTAVTRNLTGFGQPERLGGLPITAGFFEALKVQPQRGRWFTESDTKRGMQNVVVLSDSLWRRRFAADPEMIGKNIVLNDVPYEVVGIAPPDLWLARGRQLHPGIEMPERTDIFLPIRFSAAEEQGAFRAEYVAIARLKPGVTPEQARAELDSTLPTFKEFAFFQGQARILVKPLLTALVGDVRKGLMVLLISVGLVLLIACANIANLSLVRATQRSRELAIRAALGATRGKLMRLSLTESLLLAVCGTVAGSILSMWITYVMILRAPAQVPRLEVSGADVNVFTFAAAICALTTMLFGLLPAWRASHTDPQQALNAAGRGSTDTRRVGRLRAALVSLEVAVGTVLVIGSGLLLISFHRVMNVPRGFDGGDILIADLVLPTPRYQGFEKQTAFVRALHDGITSVPGVMNVAVNTRPPLTFELVVPAVPEGRNVVPWEVQLTAWPTVSSEYFGIMRIPLRTGRLFRDEGESERVAVVSESAARILWPGENPLGRRVCRVATEPGIYWRIVGVVGDVLSAGLDRASTPAIYRPFTQKGGDGPGGATFSIMLRTTLSPDALAKPVRDAIWRVDPDIPVPEIRTVPGLIANAVLARRFQALLLTVFALVAVLLAAIGIYGVVAYSVTQRRKEIGVRIALGAKQRDVGSLVFRNGMMPVFIGLAGGFLAAAVFVRLISSFLFQISALHPLTFITTALVLVIAAALPCWITARQASEIDPVLALRLD